MAELDDLAKRAIDFGFDRWHSRTGLAAVLAGIIVLGVFVFAGIDIKNVSLPEWSILAALVLIVCLVWFRTRIERAPRDRVGFGVAIEYEDADLGQKLRSDFVVTLRNLLDGSHHRHKFQFIAFPQSLAKRITNEEQAFWLTRKANLHFLIHGRARLRKSAKGPAHVLDLSWLVRHRPIASEQSEKLARDASAVFPRRYIFENAGDMFACEFAAQYVDIVARYVIGTAWALSGDFVYAEELLLDAEAKLVGYVKQAEGTPLSVLLDRIQRRLQELYRARLSALSQEYRTTRKRPLLEQAEAIALKLRAHNPDDYFLRLLTAMAAFMLRRDTSAAKRELEGCRKSTDGTWMYSEAFLIAYEGDLEAAYRTYRRAFESPLSDPNVPVECEDFIQIVLDEEPDRKWLYFCLGLLNYRAKGDLAAARADFKRFIESADQNRFKKQIGIAEKWIQEIDAILVDERLESV